MLILHVRVKGGIRQVCLVTECALEVSSLHIVLASSFLLLFASFNIGPLRAIVIVPFVVIVVLAAPRHLHGSHWSQVRMSKLETRHHHFVVIVIVISVPKLASYLCTRLLVDSASLRHLFLGLSLVWLVSIFVLISTLLLFTHIGSQVIKLQIGIIIINF